LVRGVEARSREIRATRTCVRWALDPDIDEVVTGKKCLHLTGRETIGTHNFVNFEFLAVVLLGILFFREVTQFLGERFATFQSYLCLTLEVDGSTSGTMYPVTASRRGRLTLQQ
jgi:hypothetical protein